MTVRVRYDESASLSTPTVYVSYDEATPESAPSAIAQLVDWLVYAVASNTHELAVLEARLAPHQHGDSPTPWPVMALPVPTEALEVALTTMLQQLWRDGDTIRSLTHRLCL